MSGRLLPLLLILLAACGTLAPGGSDRADQATSAQRFLPDAEGYTRSDTSSLTDALTTLGSGASLLSGNPALLAAITTIDAMIECYQQVGAVAASIYSRISGEGVSLGAVAVVNQERLGRNFLTCALGGGEAEYSAQAAAVQPCSNSGTLPVGGETIHYLYAATDPLLCLRFQSHFDSL